MSGQERLVLSGEAVVAELVRRVSALMADIAAPSPPAPLPRGERGAKEAAPKVPLSPRGRRWAGEAGSDEGAAISPPQRIAIGLVGGPGSGKSTITVPLVEALNAAGISAAAIPMDGFHMRQAKLEALGLASEKGAAHTFEAGAFADFLERAKTWIEPVSGPIYTRDIEDVTEDGYSIAPETRVLIVEGNYLLLDTAPWDRVQPLLDLSIYIDVPRDIVRARLLTRHAEHGLFTPERIARHVEEVDLPNYDIVAATARRADIVLAAV